MNNNIDLKVMYGERLAELRQSANLSADAIAKRLQIATSIVTDIEVGKTHTIPMVFLRGYIKSYASLVNLPQTELSDYLKQIETTNERPVTIKLYSQISKPKRLGKRIAVFGFFILFSVISAVGFFLWQEYQEYNGEKNAITRFSFAEDNNKEWLNR